MTQKMPFMWIKNKKKCVGKLHFAKEKNSRFELFESDEFDLKVFGGHRRCKWRIRNRIRQIKRNVRSVFDSSQSCLANQTVVLGIIINVDFSLFLAEEIWLYSVEARK